MARTINHVTLLGRVGADPELRSTKSGTAVVQLRLATDRPTKSGQSETDWHSVVAWGKTAEAVAQYVRKGDRVHVTGRLQQHSWQTDSGERRAPRSTPARSSISTRATTGRRTRRGATLPSNGLPFPNPPVSHGHYRGRVPTPGRGLFSFPEKEGTIG